MTDNHQDTGFAIHDTGIGDVGRDRAVMVTLDGVLDYSATVCGRSKA